MEGYIWWKIYTFSHYNRRAINYPGCLQRTLIHSFSFHSHLWKSLKLYANWLLMMCLGREQVEIVPQTANQETKYVCLLLLNEIIYQNKSLRLQHRLKCAFTCPARSMAVHSTALGALTFLFPEEFPNIDIGKASLWKEVCDMKCKIIVFKFVVSRLGFYCACQAFSFFFCGIATQI